MPDITLPPTPSGDYQQDLAVFVSLEESVRDTTWAQAEWAYVMTGHYGRSTAQMIAGDTGHSKAYIRMLVATAKAFPDVSDRAQDLSFSHHRVAAATQDPATWIDEAVAHQWSVEELRQAIQDTKDPVAETVLADRALDRIKRAIDKYNVEWSHVSGEQLALVYKIVVDEKSA